MKVFYDCEFWEQGDQEPIRLISIGMVAEDGRELYLINGHAPVTAIAREHPWLRENAFPHLPINAYTTGGGAGYPEVWYADWVTDPARRADAAHLRTPHEITTEVDSFLRETPDLELWGWYSAYDHVVLCQIFGTMANLPPYVPYYTNDLRQHIGKDARVPAQKSEEEHHALADARWTMAAHVWFEQQRG